HQNAHGTLGIFTDVSGTYRLDLTPFIHSKCDSPGRICKAAMSNSGIRADNPGAPSPWRFGNVLLSWSRVPAVRMRFKRGLPQRGPARHATIDWLTGCRWWQRPA